MGLGSDGIITATVILLGANIKIFLWNKNKKKEYQAMKRKNIFFLHLIFVWVNILSLPADEFEILTVEGKEIKVLSKFQLAKVEVYEDNLKPLPSPLYKYYFGALRPKKGMEFCREGQLLRVNENDSYYKFYSSDKFGILDARYSIGYFFEPIEDENQAKAFVNFIFGSIYGSGKIITSKIYYDKYMEEISTFYPNLVVTSGKPYLDFTAEPYKDLGFIVSMTRRVGGDLKMTKILLTRDGHIGVIEDILAIKKYDEGCLLQNVLAVPMAKENEFSALCKRVYKYAEEQEKLNKSGKDIYYSNCPYPVSTPANDILGEY